MSDLREALRRIASIAEDSNTASSLPLIVRIARGALAQPEAVEPTDVQRAMDMLGDVPGQTILERVERTVSYYLALQCELEKARAAPPITPDVDVVDLAIAVFLEDDTWQQGGIGIEDKRRRMRKALASVPPLTTPPIAHDVERMRRGVEWKANPHWYDMFCAAREDVERMRKALEAVRFSLVTFAKYKENSILIETIDRALSRTNEGKESEGGCGAQRCRDLGCFGYCKTSDPTPSDRREAIARIIDPTVFKAASDPVTINVRARLRRQALAKADAILAIQTRAGE